jgi:hypothetical protein
MAAQNPQAFFIAANFFGNAQLFRDGPQMIEYAITVPALHRSRIFTAQGFQTLCKTFVSLNYPYFTFITIKTNTHARMEMLCHARTAHNARYTILPSQYGRMREHTAKLRDNSPDYWKDNIERGGCLGHNQDIPSLYLINLRI